MAYVQVAVSKPFVISRGNVNLTTIEESASLLSASDISYDKTEEDLDDVSYLRGGKKWKRPSAPPLPKEDSPPEKRHRKSHERKSHDRKVQIYFCLQMIL